jgi:RNA polymerase sigma-70 factor (ECF subfamily)
MATKQVTEPDFEAIVETERVDVHAHCYRMLGSLHDADDALQETFLRAWRAFPRFEGRSSARTWLYRIATNVCLDAIDRRPKRVLPIDFGPPIPAGAADPTHARSPDGWIEAYPDEALGVSDGAHSPASRYERREALELAFVAALQHLPPRQRAVLIARDVLGFSAKEAAEVLETTPASVNGALLRARKSVEQRLPERSQQSSLRALGDERLRLLAERFADAFERGDVKAILATLSEDATFQMPPYPGWRQGRRAIAESWLMPGGPGPRLRYAPCRANGQLALGTYLLERDQDAYLPIAIDVLSLEAGGSVSGVIAFRALESFRRFGLPERIASSDPRWPPA